VSYNPGRSFANRPPGTPGGDGGDLRVAARWSVSVADPTEREFRTDFEIEEDAVEEEESGSYQLIRVVGRGGFGEVWEAVQGTLDRVVAVKRLRDDLEKGETESTADTFAMRENFRQEALTTANLDHPNIVPVHDLGEDENGSPLLAMKYVRGKPWSDMIMEEFPAMSPAEFLAKHIPILVDVTQAVAFAHSRGVVHRDLKPSQVMVGEFGEVMLMDWGLAVVMNPESLIASSRRRSRGGRRRFLPTPESASNPAGTLAFMAPEQTNKTANYICPATDVFLLGGTLYYLLTGRLPHQGESSKEIFMRARLGEVIPAEVAAPDRDIPQDLIELAAGAMRPLIRERMQTAREFLAGLQDHLSGATRRRESVALTDAARHQLDNCKGEYPVFAEALGRISRADTLWDGNPVVDELAERAHRQFARAALRNGDLILARLQAQLLPESDQKKSTIAEIDRAQCRSILRERQRRIALVGVAALLLLVVAGSSFFINRLSYQRDLAMLEKERALSARNDAQTLVSYMLGDLVVSLQPLGQLGPLKNLAERVKEYYDNVPEEELSADGRLQQSLALASLAQINVESGDSESALKQFQQALDIAEPLLAENPADDEIARDVAAIYASIGDVKAERGDPNARVEGVAKAIGVVVQALALNPEFSRQFPDSATSGEVAAAFARGMIPGDGAQLGESLAILDKVNAWNQQDPRWGLDLSVGYEMMSRIFLDNGDFARAREAGRKSVALRERSVEMLPGEAGPRRLLISAYLAMGEVYRREGYADAALRNYESALTQADEQMTKDPGNVFWPVSLAGSHAAIADVLIDKELPREAAGHLRESIALSEMILARDRDNATTRFELSKRYGKLAQVLTSLGEIAEAREYFGKAFPIASALLLQDRRNVRWQTEFNELFGGSLELGDLLLDADDYVGAEEAYNHVLSMAAILVEANPGNMDHLRDYFTSSERLGKTLVLLDRGKEAIPILFRAFSLPALEQGAAQAIDIARENEPPLLFAVAMAYAAQGDAEHAFRFLHQAMDGGYKPRLKDSPFAPLLDGLRKKDAARLESILGAGSSP